MPHDYRLTIKNARAILEAQRSDDPKGFALAAIARLNKQRTGHCDPWTDYAIGQWRVFLSEIKPA